MNKTKIEWCDYSWNPITGCLHGCWYCYAKKMAQRFKKIFPQGFKPTFHQERLKEPWEHKKPSKIFVCSISDLFGSWMPQAWRDQVLDSIFQCPIPHTFQLLTKNPIAIPSRAWPLNVWVGATVTQQSEYKLVEDLLLSDAKTVFISFEPLLGQIQCKPNIADINWAIIGKLTGSQKVKLDPQWVWKLVYQLKAYDIPIFMKNNLAPTIPKEKLIQEWPQT